MKEITFQDIDNANKTLMSTDIKGKSYIEVNQRIKAFRMVYPDGLINTEMVSNENGVCIFKAMVGYYTDEDDGIGIKWLGYGHAYERENSSFINKTSYIENCETSAVGRALGMAGFGIDTSVASYEEVANAIENQMPTIEEANNYVFTFGKYKDELLVNVIDEDDNYIDWLLENSKDTRLLKCIELLTGQQVLTEIEKEERDKKISNRMDMWTEIQQLAMETSTPIEDILDNYKVENTKDLTEEQMQEIIKILKKKKEK